MYFDCKLRGTKHYKVLKRASRIFVMQSCVLALRPCAQVLATPAFISKKFFPPTLPELNVSVCTILFFLKGEYTPYC